LTFTPRIGLTLPLAGATVQETIACARSAEQLGYDDIWFADAGAADALTLSALVAEQTNTIRLAIAVVPVYTRTPAVLANTAATISEVAPNRFILGLGSSSHTIIEGWHGLKLDKPLTRIRETTLLVKQLLAGEKTAYDGQTLRSHGYRLQRSAQIPVYLAALKPQMLELAAEIGDGIILNMLPSAALPLILDHIDSGARRANKSRQDVEVACRFQIAVTDDKEAHFNQFRKTYIPYFATPVYNRYLAWAGYPEQADQIRQGWAGKNRQQTESALSNELIDEIAIIGSKEECQQKIRSYLKAGISTALVTCVSPDPLVREQTIAAFSGDEFTV
jgi:probable F420-dependent oxidoreductase